MYYPNLLTLSLLRVINVKFPLQPHQIYYITQYGELGFSKLTQVKDDYATNSRYLTYTFSLSKVGRMYFLSSGVKGLKNNCMSDVGRICSIIIFHRSKLWKVKFSTLCGVIFLVRLQGNFGIDHPQERKGSLTADNEKSRPGVTDPFSAGFGTVQHLFSNRMVRWPPLPPPPSFLFF